MHMCLSAFELCVLTGGVTAMDSNEGSRMMGKLMCMPSVRYCFYLLTPSTLLLWLCVLTYDSICVQFVLHIPKPSLYSTVAT